MGAGTSPIPAFIMLSVSALFLATGGPAGESEAEGGTDSPLPGGISEVFAIPRAADENLVAPISVCPTTSSTQMFCLINHARKQRGLSALIRHGQLVAAARAKRDQIIFCRDFSHAACGADPFEVIRKAGYPGDSLGENLAVGYSARGAVSGWLQSDGHRANILSGYRHYGAAYSATSPWGKLWVVCFGSSSRPLRAGRAELPLNARSALAR